MSTTEGVVQPVKYGGREYDSETGFYYNRARYYDPQLGRFLSEDSLGLNGGINPYVYVGNDPVNGRDPNGLCELKQELWLGYFYADGTFEPVRKIGEFCVGSSDGGSGSAGDPGQPQSLGPQGPACRDARLALIGTAILDASFFVGLGEAALGLRLAVKGFSQAARLGAEGLWNYGGRGAFRVAMRERDAAWRTMGRGIAGPTGLPVDVPATLTFEQATGTGFDLRDFVPGWATKRAIDVVKAACGGLIF